MKLAKTAVACALVLAATHSNAATWNTFAIAFNEDALYFFDADTVVKAGDTTTVWVKYVKTKAPDDDGSWSTAQRRVINCKKRTLQSVATSMYGKDQKFMSSFNQPGKEFEPAPESIAEELVKAVCTPDFPKNTTKKLYYPVQNNDIYVHTSRINDYLQSQKDSAPK